MSSRNFTGSQESNTPKVSQVFIFSFHSHCFILTARVPVARAFHAPQLIRRRAEKTRAWPLYSPPETDKLALTPLNKREAWFRSGFYLPKGGWKGGKDWKKEKRWAMKGLGVSTHEVRLKLPPRNTLSNKNVNYVQYGSVFFIIIKQYV